MTREILKTDQAPAAIGPYSQAVIASGARTLYASGQIPLDPSSGEMVGGDDIVQQTERVMENLAGVLSAANMSFQNVVRATIYLVDLGDFGTVNEIYARRFVSDPPARACVQVAALPKGSKVEIDVIAVAD